MQISGLLFNPLITGQGTIEQLHFYVPEFGTEYQDANFYINVNDTSSMTLKGKINAGDSQLNVDGRVSIKDINNAEYHLSIVGDNFPIIDTMDVKASITPNLIIVGDAHHVAVNGSIHTPQLHIVINKLPDEVDAVSDDEIIVSETGDLVKQDKLVMTGIVDLTLGNDSTFNGYGLSTDLYGGIKITLSEHQPIIANGVLFMKNAQYTRLGQTLEIHKGDIIFSGPLDDPSLDIEIQRTSNNVTVTMLITGKADDPQTKLISDPPLSEANKLSYLLTGRSVNDLNTGEGSNLSSAALSLGLSKSSPILQEIGTKFGFDTLTVDAGENGLQSTSLLLGKHLSPKLYITYAKDLFSALGAIQMNYRLTDHISLEVESGSRQTIDLIYSINKE